MQEGWRLSTGLTTYNKDLRNGIFCFQISEFSHLNPATLHNIHLSHCTELYCPPLSRKREDIKSHSSVCLSITKTLTLAITFALLQVELWCLACVFSVTRPFRWYHVVTLAVTFDLIQGQICCRAGDHNSLNLLVLCFFGLLTVLVFLPGPFLTFVHDAQVSNTDRIGPLVAYILINWWCVYGIPASLSKEPPGITAKDLPSSGPEEDICPRYPAASSVCQGTTRGQQAETTHIRTCGGEVEETQDQKCSKVRGLYNQTCVGKIQSDLYTQVNFVRKQKWDLYRQVTS